MLRANAVGCLLLVALFVGALTCPTDVKAQVPDTALGDTLLTHRVLGPAFLDTLPVSLHRHGQYRLAIWPPATQIELVPVAPPRAPAFAPRIREGSGGRTTVIEVYPRTSALHALVVTPQHSTDTVQVWLWADRELERQSRERREREWGIGLALAAAYHTGYRTLTTETEAQPSAEYELGILFGSSRALALLTGISYDHRYPGAASITSVFAEPRVQLFRWPVAQRELTLHLTGRLAQGNSSGLTVDPVFYGLGVLLAYSLDRRPGNRGWRVGFQLSQHWVSNVPYRADVAFSRAAVGLSWLP